MSDHINIALFVPHLGCEHACAFCNQKTISGHSEPPGTEDLIKAVETALGGAEKRRAELAFFGGSFTAIERGYMLSLLDAAQPYIKSGRLAGIRCSTRPDCIDDEILDLLKSHGVTAIELGAQSMDDRVLSLNGRGHSAHAVRDASELIKKHGIELGLQMMTGLYGDSDEGAFNTARELAALRPETVRIYPTVVLKGTKLAQLCESGEYRPQTLTEAVELCARLLSFFEERGIRVIKLGLHAERSVERDYIAGAYHPALRELCEGRLYLDKMLAALRGTNAQSAHFEVNPRELSKALGQKRCNINRLGELGISVRITANGEVTPGSIRYIEQE